MLKMMAISMLNAEQFKQKYTVIETANRVDPNEVARNEPSRLDLHYLPSSL